jgi:Flp pilus assembly protein CpaB
MTYRLRNIVIALALALVAFMLTSFYVRQQREDAQQQAEPTRVYVATEDIEVGTPGAEAAALLEERKVSRENVVPGAVVSPDDVEGQVVTEKIYAGEQVTQLRFSSPTEQGVRAQISGNMRALQVAGDEHQLMEGTLKEGDHIDVVGSWIALPGEGHVSRVILRDVLVLRSVTSAAVSEKITDSEAPAKNVLLAVTDAQSQKLFWIMKNGEWSLELRPTDNPADSPESVESAFTLLIDGFSRSQLRKLLTPFN